MENGIIETIKNGATKAKVGVAAIGLAALLATPQPVEAWMEKNISLQWNRKVVVATVHNNYGRPMICNARVEAKDQFGNWGNQWFNNIIIKPGEFQSVYLNANGPSVNIAADARANCIWYQPGPKW